MKYQVIISMNVPKNCVDSVAVGQLVTNNSNSITTNKPDQTYESIVIIIAIYYERDIKF